MPAFPIDPGNITNMKRWLATQRTDHVHPLRPIEIAEILLGADVLPQLPSVLQRAGVAESATIVLVMDIVAMRRGEQELKPFVQALLRDAGYTIEPLWLENDQYGLVHADFTQVQRAGVAESATIVLVMDTVAMRRGEQELKPFVQTLLLDAGYTIEPLWLESDQYGLVHADFTQVQRVRAALRPGIALVALGSGTVTDIAKHAAYLYDQEHQAQQPIVYICCQTANSVTAFAANMAVLLKDGVKRTLPSRYPTAIISDLRVLASAPKAMTLAGLGDCCARFVAYGDWYLASALGLVEFYSEVPLALLANLEAILTAHAVAIGQRTYEGEAVVARALLLAGIAQSIVNMSAPISGTEHVISHVLDMIADHYQHGLALHGAQVGVATLTTSHLYQHFLNTFDPRTLNLDTCYPSDTAMQTHIQHLFTNIDPNGTMAQECWSDYATKLALWRQNRPHFAQFCARWQDEHRPKLASLVSSPDKVHAILAQAGAPLTPNDLLPPISQEEYDFAVRNGHFIRQRFVLGDLLYFLGWGYLFHTGPV